MGASLPRPRPFQGGKYAAAACPYLRMLIENRQTYHHQESLKSSWEKFYRHSALNFIQEPSATCCFSWLFVHGKEKDRVEAVVKTASLTASEQFIEDKLKGEDFFNVAVRPEIRFKSRAVRRAAGNAAENNAELSGDLTMNGISQPVTLRMALQKAGG
jgi:hypothetical protein